MAQSVKTCLLLLLSWFSVEINGQDNATSTATVSLNTNANATSINRGRPQVVTIPPPESNMYEPPPPNMEEYTQCGSQLTGNSGRFASPNFSDPLQLKRNCTWNITVDEGKNVKLTFHIFNVPDYSNCDWDYAKVYDTNGTLIKAVCGAIKQEVILTSKGNKMGIHFFTNGYVDVIGFLASWEAINPNEASNAAANREEGYLLVLPQTFTTSSEALPDNICLQLFNVSHSGNIDVRIFNSNTSLTETLPLITSFKHNAGDSDVHCQQVKLPSNFEAGSAVVQVEGKFEGSDYKILSYKLVKVLKLNPMLLVQTDKQDYRPMQTIKLRVLLLNYQLKPSAISNISEVWITDPLDSRLAQWSNVELKKGLAQREFALSEDLSLGQWKIHVKILDDSEEEITTFTVSENVLPKFEVTVESSKIILLDSDNVTFKICGTYTHGSKVKGNVNATFFVDFMKNYQSGWKRQLSLDTPLIDGCAEVKLFNSEMRALLETESNINVLASITEAVTGIQHNATDKVEVYSTPFVIDATGNMEEHFIGRLPYIGKVKVSRHDETAIEGVNLKVCARLFTSLNELKDNNYKFYGYTEDDYFALIKNITRLKYLEVCDNHRTKADGTFKFAVPIYDLNPNLTKLSLTFSAVDNPANETSNMLQPEAKLDVLLTHSNITSALTISSADANIKCGSNDIKILFNSPPNDNVDLFYYVSSGGNILTSGHATVPAGSQDFESELTEDSSVIDLHQGEKKPGTIVGKHIFQLKRPFTEEGKVGKTIKVLVYSRDTNNTVISAIKEFTSESCASQPLTKWSAEKLKPGDNVTLSFDGDSESFCGYSVVDKSVDLVPNMNKVTSPRLQELKEAITNQRITGDRNTAEPCKNANLPFQSFEHAGLFAMSDQQKVDDKCYTTISAIPVIANHNVQAISYSSDVLESRAGGSHFRSKAQSAPMPAMASQPTVNKNQVELRNYFPETWLFDTIDLDSSGKASVEIKVPHTVTTWIAELICSHNESGLGISNRSSLLVTQDFFADIDMPYSVKRGEIFPINITAFNSVEKRLPMKLTIKDSEAFTVKQPSQDVCLSPKDHDTKTFNIQAKELNEVNITIEAKITDSIAATPACDASGSAEGYTDILQKVMHVKPEGFPVEKVQSVFQCRNATDKPDNFQLEALTLPANLVEGSDRAYITASGDIMAPSFGHLDGLVPLPRGCGEQNMLSMASNVYLMDYLNGTYMRKPELEAKAKKYIAHGFENQERFRHSNGAYSVWGPKQDKEGSVWLTSFVLKVYSQGIRFINMDIYSLQASIDFIVGKQLKTGCFAATGYTIHSELSGAEQDITSSVLISLLQMKKNNLEVRIDEEVLNEAVKCIHNILSNTTDVYTRSLSTYALSMHNITAFNRELDESVRSDVLLQQLIDSANTSQPGKLYWTSGKDKNHARSVEMTAYNVLSLVLHDRLPEALKAIHWLAAQRNSFGGFVSTQDTVVALQAMTEYSLKIGQRKTDLKIKASENGINSTVTNFNLNEDNKLLLQRQKLPKQTSALTVDVSGEGCFMVQTILRYNVKESPRQNSFSLRVNQKDDKEMQVCAAYTGNKEKTGMVVIEVELLSGFIADEDSLKQLENEVDNPVRKTEYDEKDGKVVLYFDDMAKKEDCWMVGLTRKVRVEELKPAIAKVYDYYNKEDEFSTQYTLA